MKSKVEITVSADLDEIRHRLIATLSTKELISFVVDMGDKMSEMDLYYSGLKKALDKCIY